MVLAAERHLVGAQLGLTGELLEKKQQLTHKHAADLRETALPLQTSTG